MSNNYNDFKSYAEKHGYTFSVGDKYFSLIHKDKGHMSKVFVNGSDFSELFFVFDYDGNDNNLLQKKVNSRKSSDLSEMLTSFLKETIFYAKKMKQ